MFSRNLMKLIAVFCFVATIFLSACTQHIDTINHSLSWMRIDSPTKSVSFDLVSGWDGSNNAYNFNGYSAGGLTLKVPDGWNVTVNLTNRDSNVPHNIIVTYPHSLTEIPDFQNSNSAVIKRAYTEDVYVGEHDTMRFVAKEGEYWFFCGVSGHGINDMWINFEVNKSFSIPEVVSN